MEVHFRSITIVCNEKHSVEHIQRNDCFFRLSPSDHFPPYMQHPQMLEYLEMYAEHNHLLKYVRFETTVLNIARSNTHYKDGTWVVNYRTKSDPSQQEEIFDCVLLAQGPHARKNLPKWPNMENFEGRVIHSQDYKDFHGFEDAVNVVVALTYISTRRGSWVVSRLGARGIPIDMQFTTRFLRSYLPCLVPQSILDWLGESKLQSRFDHAKYGLIPKHRLSQQQVTMNDELPGRIICGAIIVKPNISYFTPNGVIWEDGSTTQPVDNVILCTGYRPTFDLVEDGKLIRVTENKSCLYKHMYPAELLCGGDFDLNNKLQAPKAPSLAIIGLVHASGAITSVVEMQARLFFHYFCGDLSGQQPELKPWLSPRYTFQLDYMAYMDEMAGVVGCLPKPWEYMLRDWRLAFSLIFKANLPYIYRLQGPHRWDGAREAIIKAEQRTDRGLKNL
uniref:Flavin-containing monooxygenase n=1 Tax=Ditylenchus dipsaci TaxID=166011 RepID=A0A915E8B6_9BILA